MTIPREKCRGRGGGLKTDSRGGEGGEALEGLEAVGAARGGGGVDGRDEER